MPDTTPISSLEMLTRDVLLTHNPYSLKDSEKSELLLHIIKEQLHNARRNNRYIENYFSKMGIDIDAIKNLENVPFIPVQMFKVFDLKTCP